MSASERPGRASASQPHGDGVRGRSPRVVDVSAGRHADAHLVALLGLPKLGPRRLARLLEAHPDPGRAWEAVRTGRLHGIPLYVAPGKRQQLVDLWRTAAASVDVGHLVAAHRAAGIRVLIPADADWPEAFAADPQPPPLVFVRGDPSLLSVPAVAVVGTRRCTAAGAATARELGHDLAAAGVGVVSGLAVGIDGAAHRGCLDAGGPAIGVVGTGLDVVYPRRHAGLWQRVGSEGVLLSEAPLGTNGERWRFPARNRLIAALSLVVVVVESRLRGGSMRTVESAVERGVDVMAVPGPVRSGASQGPNQLLHEGCGIVRDAADVLVALGSRVPLRHAPGPTAGAGDEPAAEVPDPVADAVSWPASSLDTIVAATGLPFTEVAARLATLELAGTIERVADGYQRRS